MADRNGDTSQKCTRYQMYGAHSSRPLAERFWSRVDKNGPVVRPEIGACWLWRGNYHPQKGYGLIWAREFNENLAHRVSYCLNNGPIPDGLRVLHACDNPPCVNPAHLRVGTQGDNARDRVERNRQSKFLGSSNGFAKLNEDQVREIRKMLAAGMTCRAISKHFPVCDRVISEIKRRKAWAHVA